MKKNVLSLLFLVTSVIVTFGAERSMTEAFSLVREKFNKQEVNILPLADDSDDSEKWQFFVDPYSTKAWPHDSYITLS